MCSAFSIYSQSVYMHEAQQDAAEGDGFSVGGFILFIVLVGIIWFISACINDYSESKRKKKIKKEETERHERIHRETVNFFDSINCKNYVTIDGHNAVDLGLQSKTLWATENIGASFYAALGDIFAWGNNEKIDRKPIYDIFHTPLQLSNLKNDITTPAIEETYTGMIEYDAVIKARGQKWRTPTESEVRELLEYCNWKYVTSSTVKGWKVIGPNGNFIFLPIRIESLMDDKTPYLTSSPDPDDSKISVCEIGRYKHCIFLMFNRIGWQDKYTHELESRGRIRGGYIRAVTNIQD